ncbi:MAG: hypothetical protein FJ144_02250 [Deltaproteobacteria bacterium]|nr:hypothetical protein [Deltaproteobacteria bacterium]
MRVISSVSRSQTTSGTTIRPFIAYPKADPLLIRQGERVQIELVNQTMMWHPMHLHGHFFRLLQGAGDRAPLKHTVNVAPRESVRIEFTADNPGRWFFHCHNLYHLEAGMARVFEYESPKS